MEKFDGFKAEQTLWNEPLPAGGYVAQIFGAKEESYDWGNVLVISFDIAEGKYAGYFNDLYKNTDRDDKKWKGHYRLTVPKEGSQYFESNRRIFNNAIWAIEESNSGYHWDWNEAGLKGKFIGVLFRNREWEYNGSTGWTTECGAVTSVEKIRTGDFKIPKDKPLKKVDAPADNFTHLATDEDLPF